LKRLQTTRLTPIRRDTKPNVIGKTGIIFEELILELLRRNNISIINERIVAYSEQSGSLQQTKYRETDGIIGSIKKPELVIEIKTTINLYDEFKSGRKQLGSLLNILSNRWSCVRGCVIGIDVSPIFDEKYCSSEKITPYRINDIPDLIQNAHRNSERDIDTFIIFGSELWETGIKCGLVSEQMLIELKNEYVQAEKYEQEHIKMLSSVDNSPKLESALHIALKKGLKKDNSNS